jgi:molybdate transport system ATP-binding protein
LETKKDAAIEEQPLLKLENITIRIKDKFILPDTFWEIKNNQNWAILGPNGSGKSSFVAALTGHVPVVRGSIRRFCPQAAPKQIGCVSLEHHQQLILQDVGRDEARFFSGKLDTFTKARQIILAAGPIKGANLPDFKRITKLLEISHILDRGIRFLSTGEMRKVLIARALLRSPKIMILDEPFEGLDAHSKEQLAETITGLMNEERQIILVTHRFEEIPQKISHVLCLKNCKVFLQGRREMVLVPEHMKRLFDKNEPVSIPIPGNNHSQETSTKQAPAVLLNIKNATVKYGDMLVLDNVNWMMKRGENWAIIGPNGSGKTTLLSLIIGDNPQAYANEIYLFGKLKGSGESIWDIKKRIGVVSSELQVQYHKRMRAYDVVLSGFFDSIGLYRKSSTDQLSAAKQWMELLGLTDRAEKRFDQLSFGEKRMVLLARSMVKSPALLILDEPCQGLDHSNRNMVLGLIDYIGSRTHTNLLYVTHHQDETPSCITHVLNLEGRNGI